MTVTWQTVSNDPDYQALPEVEKAKVQKRFFSNVIAKDPDYKSLEPEEKGKVVRKFFKTEDKPSLLTMGLAKTGEIAGTAAEFGKRARERIGALPITPFTIPLKAAKPFIPETPEEVYTDIATTVLLPGVGKLVRPAAPVIQKTIPIAAKAAPKIPGLVTEGLEEAFKAAKAAPLPKIEPVKEGIKFVGSIFENPERLRQVTDPVLKIKHLEGFVDEAIKFSKANPNSPLVLEKTKMVSDRLAETIDVENITTELIGKIGKENASRLLKEARTSAGRTLNRLSQLAKEIGPQATADLEAKVKQFIPTYMDKVIEVTTAMKLTNPITYLRNTIGNTLAVLTRMADNITGSGYDFLASKATGRPRQKFAEESVYGLWEGIKKAPSSFLETFLTGRQFGKAEEIGRRAIGGVAGEAIRVPFRILGATDEAFKTILRTQEVHSQAYKIAKLEGLTGQARFNRIQELVANPTKSMLNKAEAVAKEFTFTSDLPAFLKSWQLAINRTPGLKLVVPFFRTPANLALFAAKRTPLGLLEGASAESLAKVTNGAILGASLTMLASEGYITGDIPKNKRDRNVLLASGWRPNSIKIGDRYYGYRGFEPISSFLALAAEIAQASDKGNKEPPSQKVNDMTFAIARNFVQQPFLQGMKDLLDAIQNPERAGAPFLARLTAGFVPTGIAALARKMDPTLRRQEGLIQAVQAKLPELSKRLPPVRDVFGEPVERTFLGTEVLGDPLAKRLAELGLTISTPSEKIGKEKMTQAQFDAFTKESGRKIKIVIGNLLASPFFAKLPTEKQQDIIDDRVKAMRRMERERVKR